ncbi:phosphate transport system permease protein [Flexivirga endophytica]|uniref:Phosphate transport system permease protein n=1 Tax=Flexivirga endophytica TaxID=1849103 RepID=A0A916TFZ9_9MICO|nr:phosphate ABC transporter permease subunit PstC [Flexivirga endophytica]GGB43398.1 phosphate transport system permease protein [Flexivirga endophytica]GHB68456.1 phosphate transport system permease protein [Flexivirga endophytica]
MSSSTGASLADELPDPDGRPPLRGDGAGTGRRGDRLFAGAATGSGLIVIAMVVLVGLFLLFQAIPAIGEDKVNFLTSRQWQVSARKFGIVQMLWTTVATSVVALVIAVPFAVAIALFLTQYAPKWLSGAAASLIDLLAAVPSIVYGLWGYFIVAPKFEHVQSWISDVFGWIPLFDRVGGVGGGTTIFLAGIVLSIMVLPIVTALTREVFNQAPMAHREAALALGATKWEMIRTAVLPFGKTGIISATMLGLGRALGETVAVLYILSSLPEGSKWTWSLFNGGDTFASKIANSASEFTPGLGTGAYVAAGLVLFVLTFLVNALARVVIERKKAFTE